ncbi:hypothetical protein LOY67_14265 [Pseudomonas sp. B21-056]|jgi:hypothetical protein|uniref:hypothetical protein n=1 Tax=Pseudomonas sp. B21-056 TaxID=2895495 RepID=UPI002232AE99|nr:hypothetical protein [Pseudomonas sp. B21-056]UZE21217.1 hypothetical protein LOY67_14265 [Pseudomonas sp. B21-056]
MVTSIAGYLLAYLLDDLLLNIAITLAMAMIVGGFIMWCLPTVRWLHGAWDKPFAKTPIVLLHVFVLLVATVLARDLVAEALGLPPQTFDMTSSFLVLLFYLPAWMLVAAMVLAVAGFILTLITLIQLPLEGAMRYLIQLIRTFGGPIPIRQTRSTVLFHSIGALVASILLLKSYAYLATNFQPRLYTLVQIIALKSDFHLAPLYPGVKSREHIHPLENGFIAVAQDQSDDSVIISVRSQEGTSEPRQIGEPIASPKQMLVPLIEFLRN